VLILKAVAELQGKTMDFGATGKKLDLELGRG